MDCPSCQSKAKEISADRVMCQTCGDISRIDNEWVPTDPAAIRAANTDVVKPVEEHPKPAPKEDPPAVEVGKAANEDDEDWLTRVRLSVGGDGA